MNKTCDFVRLQAYQTTERISVDTPKNHYLFLAIKEGEGRLETKNLALPFSAGHFFLGAPGFSFALLPSEQGAVRFFCLLISEEITFLLPGDADFTDPLKQFLQAANDSTPLQGIFPQEELGTVLRYEALLASEPAGGQELAEGGVFTAPISRHLSVAFLLFAARRYRLSHTARVQGKKLQSHQKLVASAMELIQQHYTEELTLSSLADALFTSPSYLCRIFKEVSGTTVSTYLNQVRIANVKRLLSDTDELIVDIASACGYNYIPYFNQLFKRMVGVTPTEYRRSRRSKN